MWVKERKMAGIEEMALGLAMTLRTGVAPNPLPIQLRGYLCAFTCILSQHFVN